MSQGTAAGKGGRGTPGDASPPTRVGSLFTGYSGLDMAVEEHFDATTVWCSDIDPGACKIIAHRMPGIPNLGDITAVDWAAVEPVDILCGGWPCQPFSLAGKRKGAADARALWPFVAGAVRALRPRHVVLENVAAIATAGELARATADLSALGYDTQWRCLRAADVGAPHGRARIFIVASDARRQYGRAGDALGGGLGASSEQHQRPASVADAPTDAERSGRYGRPRELGQGRRAEPEDSGEPPANPTGDGRHQGWPESARLVGGSDAAQRGDAAADASGDERRERSGLGRIVDEAPGSRARQGDQRERDRDALRDSGPATWGAYEPAVRRWEQRLGRPAPAPTETSPKGSQRLSPAFVEWMMGLPAGWVCDVPGLTRNEQLKALGNGVVPQQALAALRLMASLERAA